MKIIFKTLFGSHLYGTNTENSDKDYKGIYMESLDNIILKKDKEVIHHTTKVGQGTIHGLRNSNTDEETEMKELRQFLKDCMQGQTYALDMLFSPKKLWIEQCEPWSFILYHRKKLLSRNVAPYIGYCRQQAGKYGLKGSRLGELLRVIEWLKGYDPKMRIREVMPELKESEFVRAVNQTYERKYAKGPITEHYLEVLGKKFEHQKFIKDVLPSLEMMNEKYGERARMAEKNEGVDWKAISHAYRCCYQLQQLATYGEIRFPLGNAEFLKMIKTGQYQYSFVQQDLPKEMQKAIDAVEDSPLPQEPDREFWEKFMVDTYKKMV